MGDTDIFSDMDLISEIHGVDICICPIGDRFTMGGKVAALAMTRFVKPQIAIPCHYGSFPMVDARMPMLSWPGWHGSAVKALVPRKGEATSL